MKTFIISALAVAALFAVGWLTFADSEERASISIDKQEVKQDTDQAVESTKEAFDTAQEETEKAIDTAKTKTKELVDEAGEALNEAKEETKETVNELTEPEPSTDDDSELKQEAETSNP